MNNLNRDLKISKEAWDNIKDYQEFNIGHTQLKKTSNSTAFSGHSAYVYDKSNECLIIAPSDCSETYVRSSLDKAKKEDVVNNPKHYNSHPSGIECIEITRHMNFNLGNAIKYIFRSDYKGHKKEDLEKAKWYIDDEIKRLEQESKK